MANGDLIKLGTFYLNGTKQLRATRPWRTDTTPTGAPGAGNIPKFTAGQSIEIRDTDTNDAYKLNWIEVNDGGKKLLVSDRVLLSEVSWDDLNALGFVSGKTITIDGQQYKARLLTGGTNYRTGTDAYSGGKPTNNEWDRIIANEGIFSGLPIPNSTDLDSSMVEADRVGVHNQKWNWYYMYSWCQEKYSENSAYSVYRGYISARYFSSTYSYSRGDNLGWRPALEVLNSAPLISENDRNLGNKNGPFDLTYQVSDPEGDNVSVTEKLNSTTIRTLANAPQNSNLTISIDATRLASLAINTEHTISIVATDSKGASSTRTIKFTKVNSPPQISGQDVFLGDKNNPFSHLYQITDIDGDPVNVIERINGTAVNTRNNVAQGVDLTISIDKPTLYGLAIDSIHTISIEASDDKGNVSYRNLTFRRVNAAAIITTSTPTDLGSISSPPSIIYQVSDPEGDVVNVIEYLDGVIIRQIPNADVNTDINVSLNWDKWISLAVGEHSIKVKATDAQGASSERVFTFTRFEDTIKMSMKNPVETTVKLNKLVPVINYVAPIGFQYVKIEACNNAFDNIPTWEDVTAEAISMKDYVFTNEIKTDPKWGFNMRVTIAPEGVI